MGRVDGCGYNSQLKYTICEACRPCHSILSILRLVFHRLRQLCCTFKSLKCLNPKMWRFVVDDDDNNDNDTTDYFTPCACARGNNIKGRRGCCTTVQLVPCTYIYNVNHSMVHACKINVLYTCQHEKICGALVQFGCYQHRYEWKDLWCTSIQ